jgi:hypothetical protein
MYRIYSKMIEKSKNRILRLERQEYPNNPVHDAVAQMLSWVLLVVLVLKLFNTYLFRQIYKNRQTLKMVGAKIWILLQLVPPVAAAADE